MPGPVRGDTTNAFLESSYGQIDDWLEYSVTSDLLQPGAPFSFGKPCPPTVNGKRDTTSHQDIAEGMQIRLRVASERGTSLQLTGRLYKVTTKTEKGTGSIISASGYSHMQPLMNACVMPGLAFANTNFATVIRETLAPFGFDDSHVLIDNAASRGFLVGKNVTYAEVDAPGVEAIPIIGSQLMRKEMLGTNKFVIAPVAGPLSVLGGVPAIKGTVVGHGPGPIVMVHVPPPPRRKITIASLDQIPVDKARPHAGETVWAFLSRHALRYNLLIWGTADGKIVFAQPDYAQTPIYSFNCWEGARGTQNNVISIERIGSLEHRASEINVYGHAFGGDGLNSSVHAVVYDREMQSMGIYCPITIHDNSARTRADGDRRAQHELSLRRQTATVVRVTVASHAFADGSIYAIDTVANVDWDAGGVHGPMYVIRRTFTSGKHTGKRTQLDLVPLNSIVLGDPSA